MMLPQCKKRRMHNGDPQTFLPTSLSSEYFVEPSISELVARESIDPGYCSRVPDFVIGRVGYGYIKFIGETDVRWLNLHKIVKLNRHSVTVYENECDKPPIGQGLNKTAEVTLILQLRLADSHCLETNKITSKLRKCTDRQGAKFLSFDQSSGEWKFLVHHFSRFGLGEDEEDDITMDVQPAGEDLQVPSGEIVLSHSLPAHLGLDPARMQELRMLMFPAEEEELIDGSFPSDKRKFGRELMREKSPSSSARGSAFRSSLEGSTHKAGNRISPSPLSKPPLPLLEYNISSSDISPSRGILMTAQNKGLPLKMKKAEGFKMDVKHVAPLSGRFSSNIVDAALFMGRSFRVGWGPNGILVHTGTPVGKARSGLSSVIHLEQIAIDGAVRDKQNKIREELVDFCFSDPLKLHKSLNHETVKFKVDKHILNLQKIVSNRTMLPEICRSYIGIIEKQLEVSDLSTSTRVFLMHQVTVWELIKVLFSERETNGNFRSSSDDVGEDMLLDKKDGSLNIDADANPLLRRAEFSYWLQDSVCHRVQVDVSSLNDSKYLENILVLLTGRQLDAAVELAASKGDVRLAILLSQAGGSMVNRADMAQQLDMWKVNGMDFTFIEKERLKLYELLSGNIQGALQDSSVDWKRYLGLVMWYQLPPDTQLPRVINTYTQLLSEGRAPHPVPVYVDEGPIIGQVDWRSGDRYDIAYYFMLLHANGVKDPGLLKVMFSAFSSTFDPLDYHMIWHQRVILESIGAFSSNDLHVLDISFVSQLLCLGLCHWAIYVVIHMPCHDEFPLIHANLIKEILLQYCETWSTSEAQQQFIVDLGVPSAWMHEALATYYQYYGNLPEALEHFLECSKWQKAHSIFMTTVVHSLFLSSSSAKDSEIWRTASIMEEHKSEIGDWDVGAGIFIDFYAIRSSLQEDISLSESDVLAEKNEECRNFFGRLNQSLRVWGNKFPIDARATYSRMAEELCDLLQSIPGQGSTPSVHMSCFETMLGAPIPQDLRSSHLQEAITVFSYILAQSAS